MRPFLNPITPTKAKRTPNAWLFSSLLLLAITVVSQAAPQKGLPPSANTPLVEKPRYNNDVLPILAENCFPCHGPDSASRKAGLRLDKFLGATMQRDGHAAIVPGDVVLSEVVRRVLKADNDPLRMPPNIGHKSLTPAQKRTLLTWIDQGAAYEQHWSYIPPKRPALPTVKKTNWVRNPIDRFVLAKLESVGLAPAPEADRRTLARRVSLDLIGLPPTPEEVEKFVNDPAPDAYEKYVDRLLANPHWGEHRGRYWLDAARYADTHGIHFDNFREMWSYRDWVINAFNQNMPFDEFTIEQLAGDLLPNPTRDQRIATGFTRCNITTNEGGAIDEEYRVLYDRDRTETAAQVWLGTTAGCAVCHDHKFDPISQKEFYSLAAFFNNTTQNAMDGNVKDTPPTMPVALEQDRSRYEVVKQDIDTTRKQADALKGTVRPDFDRWLSLGDTASVASSIPTDGLRFHAPLNEGQGNTVKALNNGQPLVLTAAANPNWDNGAVAAKAFQRQAGSVIETPQAGDFDTKDAFSYGAWVKLAPNAGGALIARMDDQHDYRGWDMWVEGMRIGTHIISKWPEDAVKVVTRDTLEANTWHHVFITYNGHQTKDSIRVYIDGTLRDTDAQADSLKNTIRTTVPFKIGQRHTTAQMDGTAIQDIRLYGRELSPDEVKRLAKGTRATFLVSRGSSLSVPEKDELFSWWLTGENKEYQALDEKLTALQAESNGIMQRGTVAYVAQERSEEAMAYVLFRGEYDKRRDPVKPNTPAALPAMPPDLPKNRLGLAKWLFLPEHPLTARVTVNRYWQELFGTGLVKTAGDFGVTGEMPSHPELLDWMAVEYRAMKWDTKRFFKMLVTSATYRQSAFVTPEKKLKDPQNRLISRGPRFRMDAEMVRDYALASSGLLVPKLGGPSVKPYQPDGVWEAVAIIGSNTRDYKRDAGENLYRRSMYTFWKRSAPPASMEIMNAPSREVCTMRRERTDTPIQALVTMNDVQFVEAARTLAERALFVDGGDTDIDHADYIARRLLSRPLQPAEQTVLMRSLTDLEQYYTKNPKDAESLIHYGESQPITILPPTKLAAWTMLTNQMMNMDEVLNK